MDFPVHWRIFSLYLEVFVFILPYGFYLWLFIYFSEEQVEIASLQIALKFEFAFEKLFTEERFRSAKQKNTFIFQTCFTVFLLCSKRFSVFLSLIS